MLKKVIAVLCAVVLAAALFSGCAKKDIKIDGTATDVGAATATDADAAAKTGTDTGTGTAAGEGSSAVSFVNGNFPTGGWEDSVVRFEFNPDGSGLMMYKADYDGDSLTYEAVAGKNSITVRFGSADDSEEVSYETPDANTLVLKFADGQTYTLASADDFAFPISGVWENEKVSYAFRDDYSGSITGKEDGSDVGFEFDVFSSDYVFILMSSPNDAEIVKYELPDENTLRLTYKDGTDVTLRRAE